MQCGNNFNLIIIKSFLDYNYNLILVYIFYTTVVKCLQPAHHMLQRTRCVVPPSHLPHHHDNESVKDTAYDSCHEKFISFCPA